MVDIRVQIVRVRGFCVVVVVVTVMVVVAAVIMTVVRHGMQTRRKWTDVGVSQPYPLTMSSSSHSNTNPFAPDGLESKSGDVEQAVPPIKDELSGFKVWNPPAGASSITPRGATLGRS